MARSMLAQYPMCLGVPMEILERDEYSARCGAKGIERVVSLMLLEDQTVAVGDHVLVHIGYAIQRLSAEEARSAWEALDELFAVESRDPTNLGLAGIGDA